MNQLRPCRMSKKNYRTLMKLHSCTHIRRYVIDNRKNPSRLRIQLNIAFLIDNMTEIIVGNTRELLL